MRFLFLTFPEVEGVAIRWDEHVVKSADLVAAALAAGFSQWEVDGSPVGFLEQEFILGGSAVAPIGARSLIGMNGSTLIELP